MLWNEISSFFAEYSAFLPDIDIMTEFRLFGRKPELAEEYSAVLWPNQSAKVSVSNGDISRSAAASGVG